MKPNARIGLTHPTNNYASPHNLDQVQKNTKI
ncbi:hypothetical protein CRC_02287 [Cylindrospermopsis raciborskii CS-505]|nr:hypothetical protein CRC_02287 [Cylindrospermopsis raciborskii CS-505]